MAKISVKPMAGASESIAIGSDPEFLTRALAAADANVLRLALYQQTRDERLAAMQVERVSRLGSPFEGITLSDADQTTVRALALSFLRGSDVFDAAPPSRAEAGSMMEMFAGAPLSDAVADYAWEDMDFAPFARGADWTARPPRAVLDQYFVTIIGAGFSGLLAAIQLKRLGLRFRIIERQAGLGGTWWLNEYPEARVDVPSMLYQFKFESDYVWKSFFATQQELLEYVDYIVDKYELRQHISLNTKVVAATWADADSKWRVEIESNDGSRETLNPDFLVSASGQFSTPKLPAIEGIERFKGAMFHSTGWDHAFNFAGKRVAVIGTGSTGTQMVRGLAAKAASVTIYQRTPNWLTRVVGYRDEVPEELRWLFDNMPGYAKWHIFALHMAQLQMDGLHDLDPAWRAQGGQVNEKNDHLREGLKRFIQRKVGDDAALAARLTPDYAPLARRLVVDNDWYDSLMLDHVDLVSGPIQRFTETGIVSADGVERPFDLIVLSAGFDVERFLWPAEYTGRDGAKLGDLWEKDGARAYLALMLPHFPNFVMMYGPNAGILSGSFHSWIENYTRYFCKLITTAIETSAKSFEVRREAFDAYNVALDAALKKKLFEMELGGGGYYLNAHGRPGVSMPWSLAEFYEMIRAPRLNDFDFR